VSADVDVEIVYGDLGNERTLRLPTLQIKPERPTISDSPTKREERQEKRAERKEDRQSHRC
jgi:hypothetical protein